MAPFEKLIQQLLKEHHLSACSDELVSQYWLHCARVHWPVEEEGMRAYFAKLHNSVLKPHIINLLHYSESLSRVPPTMDPFTYVETCTATLERLLLQSWCVHVH